MTKIINLKFIEVPTPIPDKRFYIALSQVPEGVPPASLHILSKELRADINLHISEVKALRDALNEILNFTVPEQPPVPVETTSLEEQEVPA